MAKRFGEGLTEGQMKLARRFERAGLCSISQAVKAFQRNDHKRIAEWKIALAEVEASLEQEKRRLDEETKRAIAEIRSRLLDGTLKDDDDA